MKSVLKRRKHRKGIRPVRKGTLKVRMVEFPSRLLQNSLLSAIFKRVSTVGYDILVKPNENTAQKKHAYWVYRSFYDKANKGYDFVITYKQINPIDLALNVVNFIDPVYSKSETMEEKCPRCPLYKDCSFKCYSEPEHRFRWCQLGRGSISLAPIAKELSTTDMAELALTHLS